MAASKKLTGPKNAQVDQAEAKQLIKCLHDALYASKVCSYAQGMALIKAGSDQYNWNVDLSECARIWKGGCIIRAKLLAQITAAFKRDAKLPNLLMDSEFGNWLNEAQDNWRQAIYTAVKLGIPVPALSASLAYFDSYRSAVLPQKSDAGTDSYRSAVLPQNLTQAQRDFFGAHTFERVDKPQAGFAHVDWMSLVRTKAAKK